MQTGREPTLPGCWISNSTSDGTSTSGMRMVVSAAVVVELQAHMSLKGYENVFIMMGHFIINNPG